MASLQRRLLMERTEAERLRMGCAMFDAARALMRAGLGDATGTDRSAALRVRLFERTYGSDFDATTAAPRPSMSTTGWRARVPCAEITVGELHAPPGRRAATSIRSTPPTGWRCQTAIASPAGSIAVRLLSRRRKPGMSPSSNMLVALRDMG
jgi:hypothetical protein